MYMDITGIAVKLDSRSALSPLASCWHFLAQTIVKKISQHVDKIPTAAVQCILRLVTSEPSPTSANACGEVTSCEPAAKRSACVAPEMDLG